VWLNVLGLLLLLLWLWRLLSGAAFCPARTPRACGSTTLLLLLLLLLVSNEGGALTGSHAAPVQTGFGACLAAVPLHGLQELLLGLGEHPGRRWKYKVRKLVSPCVAEQVSK